MVLVGPSDELLLPEANLEPSSDRGFGCREACFFDGEWCHSLPPCQWLWRAIASLALALHPVPARGPIGHGVTRCGGLSLRHLVRHFENVSNQDTVAEEGGAETCLARRQTQRPMSYIHCSEMKTRKQPVDRQLIASCVEQYYASSAARTDCAKPLRR